MREIKFRAWDARKEKMISSDELMADYRYFDLMVSAANGYRTKVMQYTGLKDKNGKEIYEGDIVKWGHLNQWSREQPHRIAEVKFDPDIQFHSQVGVFNFGSFAYRDTTETDLEVLGNIYESPELMV